MAQTPPVQFEQQLIKYNRPGTKLTPIGLIVHSTANPGATAQGNHDYFNSGDRGASAHGFSDWLGKAIQCIPFNEQAWHAYSYANGHFIGWEICEATNAADFAKGLDLAAYVAATICLQFQFDPTKDMHSHQWVSQNYEGDHQDPIPYFTKWGYTWDRFVQDVSVRMTAMQPPVQNADLVRVVTADALNVRVNPDASANVRYVLKKDQTIHISKLQGDWAYTTYGALGGWVARQYLSEPPKAAPAPVQAPQMTSPSVGTDSAPSVGTDSAPSVGTYPTTPTLVAGSGDDPLLDQAIKAAQALTDCLSKMKGGN